MRARLVKHARWGWLVAALAFLWGLPGNMDDTAVWWGWTGGGHYLSYVFTAVGVVVMLVTGAVVFGPSVDRLQAELPARSNPTPKPLPRLRPLAEALVQETNENARIGVLPLATELRDIRRKIEKLKSMPTPIYWGGFQLPAARWNEYHKALSTRPKLYAAVEQAYVAANDVNEAVNHRRSIASGRQIGPNPLDGLDKTYELAGEALDALKQPRGEPWEPPSQKIAREILADEPPSEEPRKIVDTSMEYLTGLFKDHTAVQSRKLVAPYIGKWMYHEGDLGDVDVDGETVAVTFKYRSYPTAFCYFPISALDSLEVLQPGTRIKLLGRIDSVWRTGLHLADCELVE